MVNRERLCFFLALLFLFGILPGCMAGCGSVRSEETLRPAEEPDPGTVTYTVSCYSEEDHEGIGGVIVNFCTDTSCVPVTSSESGEAIFTGPPAEYHVQIVKVPDGWAIAQGEGAWVTGPFGEIFPIPFVRAEN